MAAKVRPELKDEVDADAADGSPVPSELLLVPFTPPRPAFLLDDDELVLLEVLAAIYSWCCEPRLVRQIGRRN